METIGQRITRIRDEKRMNVPKLAKLAELSDTQMRKIERGEENNPRRDTLERIAKALNVSVSFLMEGKENPHSIRPDSQDIIQETVNATLKAIYNEKQTEEKLLSLKKIKEYSTSYSKKCPLLSGNASCGQPFTITDNCIEDHISYPDNIETPDFAIEAKGVSMLEKGIAPGTICFIKKCQPSNGDQEVNAERIEMWQFYLYPATCLIHCCNEWQQ